MPRKLLIGSVLASAGVVAAVLGMVDPKPVYSLSVSELMRQGRFDEQVRVRGRLVKGSLCRVEEPCAYRFRMVDSWPNESDAGYVYHELAVRYDQCVVPDTFRDVPGLDVEVTVEGKRCATCHHFEASQVMAKCPGKYEMRRYGVHVSPYRVPTCKR